jgi:hypothetical protein
MTTAPTKLEIIHTYRRLYRGLLQGVSYAQPARFVVRDQLRAAFREKQQAQQQQPSSASDGIDAAPLIQWNRDHIKRTVWFCEAAARERGIEHRILKNLVRVKMAQYRDVQHWRKVFQDSKDK